MTTYSPWEHIAEWPDVEVAVTDLPYVNGCWIPSEQVILISRRLGQAGRRCTLAHEVVHLEEQHDPDATGHVQLRQEQRARAVSARRLIPLDSLTDALMWALGPDEVAELLHVEPAVVRTRIRNLTEREKCSIEQNLAQRRQDSA